MPMTVRYLKVFDRRLVRLERKYPRTSQEVRNLVHLLIQGQRPGEKITGTGFPVYKVRLPNRAARRGKSGGFRVIYYAQIDDVVTLLTIYSKTEIRDISLREIQALAQAADEARQK